MKTTFVARAQAAAEAAGIGINDPALTSLASRLVAEDRLAPLAGTALVFRELPEDRLESRLSAVLMPLVLLNVQNHRFWSLNTQGQYYKLPGGSVRMRELFETAWNKAGRRLGTFFTQLDEPGHPFEEFEDWSDRRLMWVRTGRNAGGWLLQTCHDLAKALLQGPEPTYRPTLEHAECLHANACLSFEGDPFRKKGQLILAEAGPALNESLARVPLTHRIGPFRRQIREVSLDLSGLTVFADYQIPRTLAQLGALDYDPELRRRIQKRELLEPNGRFEKGIRGATVVACERLAALTGRPATEVDFALWTMRKEVPEEVPFHLCWTTAY